MNLSAIVSTNRDAAASTRPCRESLPPAANFSDGMRKLGAAFQTMQARIRPVFFPIRLFGPAYPVQCYPGATWALEKAIEEAPVGAVLVVDGGGFEGGVLMGGLMSLRANQRGLAGAVIDGAIRDTAEIRQAEWPIFAAATTPSAGTHEQLGTWGLPVSCGGITVDIGDWIVGDEDGVVVIPQQLWPRALEAAKEVERKEMALESSLRQGLSLAEAVERLGKSDQ